MKWLWLIGILGLSHRIEAQGSIDLGVPLAKIELSQIDLVSLDTRDQIFISRENGDVLLFTPHGKQLNFFSPPRQARLQQLEASWTVNIFSFSTDLQEYRILDRFLNPLIEKTLVGEEIGLPKAATLGNNNVIWVWDESDLRLKSLNYLQNKIIQSQPLNLILEEEDLNVLEIREIKNRVFMNIPESGVYIFDNQGNFIQKVPVQVHQRLCIFKDRIFWLEKGGLRAYSIQGRGEEDFGKISTESAHSLHIGQEIIVIQSLNGIQVFPLPEGLKKLK
jgi:hypothetical protein